MNRAGAVEEGGSTMETKTYRGRSLEEILPRIKAELGPDAVITRQRNGLTGGVGGFFQRECIEVEVSPAERLFDAYDEEPEAGRFVPDELPAEAATNEGLSSRAIQEMLSQAAPFAEHLSLAESGVEAASDPSVDAPAQAFPEEFEPPSFASAEPPPRRAAEAPIRRAAEAPGPAADAPPRPAAEAPVPAAAVPPRPAAAETLEQSLVAAGLDAWLAAEVVSDTAIHLLPFASNRSLKRLVRAALARRIAVEPGASGHGRTLAFVGPAGSGKTLCSARLAAAYAAAGTLPVLCVALRAPDGGAELRTLLEPLGVRVLAAANGAQARALIEPERDRSVVVVDTPAVAATVPAAVEELAVDLAAADVGEVHLTLPATVSSPAARELLDALAGLGVSRVALTHSDASTRVGGLLGAVICGGTPISYVSRGAELPGGLEPASADALAGMVVT